MAQPKAVRAAATAAAVVPDIAAQLDLASACINGTCVRVTEMHACVVGGCTYSLIAYLVRVAAQAPGR